MAEAPWLPAFHVTEACTLPAVAITLDTAPGLMEGVTATRGVDRLLQARKRARTPDERAQVELQIAVICDAANRYGRTLAETAEL